MTENEKRLSAEERKKKIRERYKGVDKDELEFIPAREIVSLKEDTSYKRVAAYCRVSTDDPNQTSYLIIIPFIRLYTHGVNDVNYIIPILPALFCSVQLISWSRYIAGNLTGLAGYAKRVAVINADDYYGKEAYRQMHDWLILDHADNAIAMAGFILKNTLSDNGGVTRGVCKVAEGHTHIIDVVETSNIIKVTDSSGKIGAEADGVKLNPESYVSMNFWGFPAKEGCAPAYLDVLEQGFKDFFGKEVKENPLKAEYLLPTHIGGLLRDGKCTVKVLETKDKWFGVTYKEDKESVVQSFKKLIADGVYQEELYSDL